MICSKPNVNESNMSVNPTLHELNIEYLRLQKLNKWFDRMKPYFYGTTTVAGVMMAIAIDVRFIPWVLTIIKTL